MQLIIVLLATVSILTFLSGFIVFAGARKGERAMSTSFFIAAIFATIWMASISLFLTASPDSVATIDWHVRWTFISAIVIDTAFLGYIAWEIKYGKLITYLYFIFGSIISALIFYKPELLYNEVILSHAGNSVIMNIGPLYFGYISFFGLIVPTVVFMLLKQFLKSRSVRKKNGDLVIMVSFGLSSTLVLIANLILPLLGNWQMIWLGPLALSATIIAFYYTILRYHSLNLSSIWLKVFSYIVIIASLAIIYMIIFALIFAALFRGSTPSTEVIILNFIMILIFLLLMPAMNELSSFIRSLITGSNDKNKKGK